VIKYHIILSKRNMIQKNSSESEQQHKPYSKVSLEALLEDLDVLIEIERKAHRKQVLQKARTFSLAAVASVAIIFAGYKAVDLRVEAGRTSRLGFYEQELVRLESASSYLIFETEVKKLAAKINGERASKFSPFKIKFNNFLNNTYAPKLEVEARNKRLADYQNELVDIKKTPAASQTQARLSELLQKLDQENYPDFNKLKTEATKYNANVVVPAVEKEKLAEKIKVYESRLGHIQELASKKDYKKAAKENQLLMADLQREKVPAAADLLKTAVKYHAGTINPGLRNVSSFINAMRKVGLKKEDTSLYNYPKTPGMKIPEEKTSSAPASPTKLPNASNKKDQNVNVNKQNISPPAQRAPLKPLESIVSKSISWERTYAELGNCWGQAVAPTNDGGYLVVGQQHPPDWNGPLKGVIVKADRSGNEQTQFIMPDFDYPVSIIMRRSGGYYVVGANQERDGNRIMLSIIDSNSNVTKKIILPKLFAPDNIAYVYHAEETADQGIILAGRSSNPNTTSMFITKISSAGSIEWNKKISEITNLASSVDLTCDSFRQNYYVSSIGKNEEVILAKLNRQGKVLWEHTYNVKDSMYTFAGAITAASDGGCLIAVNARESKARSNVVLMEINKDGSMNWYKTIAPYDSLGVGHMIQTRDKGYLLLGSGGGNDEARAGVMLTKIDSLGNIMWSKLYDSTRGDNSGANSVCETSDGFVVAGTADNKLLLIKTDANGNISESR
jgi:hypothetical protein